ncbi:hypothetical protein PAXRUDRAFT_168248, partial [Paxillus rubicundulus Ve08.2h10]
LLIMGIIIKFRGCQGSGIEHNRMEFLVRTMDREDSRDGIVRSIGLNGDRTVQNPMSKDRGHGEGFLENDDIRVIEYKSAIKIGKPEEGLNVLHFVGFRPILNCLDFFRGHCQS